ncbi:hypothetical protein [Bacillus sp. SG-1]|nr:hypothetical protein [Bacillus sp. SG-1]EDL65103.1 hypothetical protein BSG1_07234 [Bacillus sp. SG-1]
MMKDNPKKQNEKQNFQEEFGMEFGDFNAAKHFEIPEANKKQDKKKDC